MLVALNGFFVAAEFALVRARESRMEQMRDEGKRGAALALEQIDRIDEYLSACQLGITMASIGIGFLGEPAIASLLEEPLGDVASHGVAIAIALAIAYSGHEPRTSPSASRCRRSSRSRTPRTRPGVPPAACSSSACLQAVHPRAEHGLERDAAHDRGGPEGGVRGGHELRRPEAADRPQPERGKLDPGEAVMLSGVFHLHEQEARQVMTPIPAVVTIDVSENVEAALRRCVDSGHTRLVVTEEQNTDRIRGIVHINSLARRLLNEGPEASIEPSVRDAMIVPETKPLDDLLADLQRERRRWPWWWTSTAAPPASCRSRTSSRRSSARSPTRPIRRWPASASWRTATGGCAATCRSPTCRLRARPAGGLGRIQLGRRLRVQRDRPLPKRGDMVRANGYSLRVEAVRENRVEAVRIRDHEPDGAARGRAAAQEQRRERRARPESVRGRDYFRSQVPSLAQGGFALCGPSSSAIRSVTPFAP